MRGGKGEGRSTPRKPENKMFLMFFFKISDSDQNDLEKNLLFSEILKKGEES